MPLPEENILEQSDILARQREPGFETENLPSPRGFDTPAIAPIPLPGTGEIETGTGIGGSQDYLARFNQSILGKKNSLTPGNLPTYTAETVYNPRYKSILPGEDSEEAFAKGQSAWKQWGNAIVKMGATAVGTFLNGMASIPDTISSIKGNSPYDTTLGNEMGTWLKNFEDKFPNYYTKWESEHPFRSALPFSGGFSNFWGDKFIKNLGFTAGAIGSAVLTDAVVGLITEGVGEIPLVAQQMGKAALFLNKVFTGTNRAEELLQLGRQAGRTGEQLLDLKKLANAAAATKLSNGAKYAINLYGATASEAGFEARDGYNTIREDLIKSYQNEKGYSPTGKDLQDIESYARAGGNVRFGLNMALLGISNALQFDAILKPFTAAKAGIRSTIQRELESGASIGLRQGSIDTFEALPRSLWNKVKPVIPSVLSEGVFEEGGQYAAQVGVENFYERKYLYDKGLSKSLYKKDETPWDSRDHINNIVHSFVRGMSDEFGTDEGLENVILGSLTGAAFGGVGRFMDRAKSREETQTTLNLLNRQGVTGILSNMYDSAATAQRISEDMKQAVKSNDIFKYKNFQHEQFTNFIVSGIKAGRFDVRMEQLDMLKDMDNDEFKKAFGLDKTNDNVRTATEYIEALKDKAKKIKRSYDIINDTFSNPFQRNTKAQTKDEVLENQKHQLFESWKDALVYLASINSDSTERINSISRDLRTIDPNLDQYHVANFTDRQYLKAYAEQMDKESKGLESLIKQGVSSDAEADRKRVRSLDAKSAEIDMILAEANPSPKKFEGLFGKLLNYHLNAQNDGGPERIPQESIPKLIEYGKDIHRLRKYRESANQAFDKLSTEEGFNRYFREAEIANEKYAEKKSTQKETPEQKTTVTTPSTTPTTPSTSVTSGRALPKEGTTMEIRSRDGRTKTIKIGEKYSTYSVAGEESPEYTIIARYTDDFLIVKNKHGKEGYIEDDVFFDRQLQPEELENAKTIKSEVDNNTSVDDIPPVTQGGTKIGEKKKDLVYGLYSTTDPVYSRQDIPFNNFHRRHQNFLFDMGSSDPDVFNQDNKPKLRIIPVTSKTEEGLGFPKGFALEGNIDNSTIRAVYIIDDTVDPTARTRQRDTIIRAVQNSKKITSDIIKANFRENPEQAISEWYTQALQAQGIEDQIDESILDQIIDYSSQGLFFADSKGEKLGKVGETVDPNQAIFSTFATTDLTFEGTGGREQRYTNKENLNEAETTDWWKEQRADILSDTTADQAKARTYQFDISRGISLVFNEQSKNNPIDVGLIREQDLDKSIITIPTLGDVAVMGAYNEEGEGISSMKSSVTMPPGTPLLNYGGSLNYLNVRTFTESEAKNIFEILKVISDRSKSSEYPGLFKYLHKVIFMANLEKDIQPTNSSITINGPSLYLGKELSPIDMTPDSLEANKGRIIDFLKTAHHGIKNSELLKIKNDPRSNDLAFPEIKIVDGQVTIPYTWKNYNHYLLSNKTPEGRNRDDAPLSVNVAVPQQGERPIIQKYSVVKSFDFDPSKFRQAQPTPREEVGNINNSASAVKQVMSDVKAIGVNIENLDKLRDEYENSTTYTDDEIGHLLGAVDYLKDKIQEAKKQQGVKEQEVAKEEVKPMAPPELVAEQQKAALEYIEIGGTNVAFTTLARDKNGNITDVDPVGILKADGSIAHFKDKERGKAFILNHLAQNEIKEDNTTDPDDDEGLGRGGFTQQPDRYRIFHPGNSNYTRANLDEEFNEVKRIINGDFFKLQKTDELLRITGGGFAWGALQDNMIYIYKNAEVGTTYHEAFEAVWYHFVTGKEQQQIYDEFVSRKGEFTTFENKKKNFSEASFKEAKEQLAEEFRDYKLTGKLPIQKKQRTFFQKLLDFIKWLIGMEASDRNSLFKRMNKGYYRNAATSLRGPMITPEYSYYREPGLEDFSETIVQDVLQGMTSELLGKLFGENSSILDQLEKDFKTTAGSIYGKLKEDLTFYFEDKASNRGTLTAEYGTRFQVAKTDEDRATMIAQVKSIRKEWQKIKTNWNSFVREHMRYLRTFNIEFVIDDEGEVTFTGEIVGDDENKNMVEYDRDILQHDAKNSASNRIKLLIASIADSEWIKKATEAGVKAADSVRSKRESSSMALPKLVQYAKLFNYLLHNSAGINGFYGIWKKFTKITDDRDTRKPVDANVRKLMSRVPFDAGFQNKTRSDARIVLSLENTLTKQKPAFFKQFTDFQKDTYFKTTVLNSKLNQVKSAWIANIKGSTAVRPSAENRFVFSKDVVLVKDNVEFLNRLGINITRGDYSRLTGKRVQKFNDEVNNIRNLIQEAANKGTSIPIISSKQIDFEGRLNGLADLYVTYMVGEDTQSQHPNLDGEPTSNFILNNFVSTIVNDANESETREDFINKPDNQYFRDIFHEDSILLNKIMFDFNTGKKSKSVEVGVVEGRETWDKNNKSTSKLTEAERQLYEINNNLNGVFYTLLPADAKTEWALNIGTYLSSDAFFGTSEQRSNEVSNFSNQMYRWLQTEILLAQNYDSRSFIDNLRRIPKGETRPVGKSLRFFKDILPKDIVNDIHEKVIDGDKNLEDVLSRDQMRSLMRDYAIQKMNRTIDNLIDWKVLTLTGKNYQLRGFDKGVLTKFFGKKSTYSLEEVQMLIMFREMNYVMNAIEMHKFFFGDPAQYKDELKRIKSFLSGREYMHVDQLNTPEGFNAWANTELNKTAQGQKGISLSPEDPGYQFFKNHYNTVTLRDVLFESNEIETLKKLLKDKVEPYEAGNEDDAGAYMMPTSYRETMWKSGGRFTEAQEDQFQWEMAWERNDKFKEGKYIYSSEALRKHDEEILEKDPDTEVAFPILKLMHSGIQTREGVAIVSLDKASWAPMFYRWYKELGLGKLYDAMQKRGTDYVRMESAHKVGIQQDSFIPLYDEKGEINTKAFDTIVHERIPMKQIGIQVEQAKKEKGQTEGSQLRKIALSDLLENGVPIDFMSEEKDRAKAFEEWSNIESEEEKRKVSHIYNLVKQHNEALINLTLARTQGAMKRMGMIQKGDEISIPDKKLISDFILSELERRELPRNIAASIQISPETRDFSNPLEANPQYSKIRSIIYSILEKTITRPKVNGGQKTMLSVTGMEKAARVVKKTVNGKPVYTSDTLKFYKQSETGTEACEVMLPYWFGKKLMEAGSKKTKEEVLKYLNNTEEGQKLLRGIGFRIPTQGLNSVDFFKVKDFLPEQMGDVVVLPSEITAKAGSDFDIDKLNVYLRNYYIDGNTGLPKIINYNGSEQKTKEHILRLIKDGNITEESVRKDLERYIAEETEGFEEGGLFESIPGAEELFGTDRLIEDFLKDREINVLNMYYQKTLENEYFDTIEKILALPENFSRLIQPNDASELKGYRDKMLKLKSADKVALGDYGKLLDSTFMVQERQAYMSSKQVVGISAVSQTAHAMGQNIEGGLVITDPEIVARFPHNEIDGRISLSGLTSKDGEGLISNINSQTTDGGVDVAKDKFLAEMGINQDTLSTFLTLVRMGAKPWWAISFINQPAIQNFLKAKAISRSVSEINPAVIKENDRALTLKTMQEFGGAGPNNQKIANKPKEYLLKATATQPGMEEMIEKYSKDPNSLTAEEKIHQMMILDDFKTYSSLAWDVFHFYQGYNWDTARVNDPNLVRLKKLKFVRANNLSMTPASKLLENTFIGTMKDQIIKLDDSLRSLINVQQGAAGDILNNAARQVFYMGGSEDVKLSILNNIELSLVDYAIHTGGTIDGKPINSLIPLLITSKNSVAEYIYNLKRVEDKKISENPFLKALVPNIDKRPGYPSYVLMPERDYDTYTSNVLTDSFRELKEDNGVIVSIDNNKDNDKSVAQIYKRLSLLALLQGGSKSGRNHFSHLIPSETYTQYVRDSLVNMKVDNFLENLVIYRTGWNNSALVPHAVPEYLDERDQFEGVPPTFLFMKVPQIINTLARITNMEPGQIPTIYTPKSFGTRNSKVLQMEELVRDENTNQVIDRRIRLFRRVDVLTSNGMQPLKYGASGRLLFVEMNAWGDQNLKEFYKDARPSVLPHNSKVTEIGDDEILYALLEAKVQTNAADFAIGEVLSRFENQQTNDEDDIGNEEPFDPTPDPFFQVDEFESFKETLQKKNCE